MKNKDGKVYVDYICVICSKSKFTPSHTPGTMSLILDGTLSLILDGTLRFHYVLGVSLFL